MIRRCSERDVRQIYRVINDAAQSYQDVIPSDCYREPYMPLDKLVSEMSRITFYGWEQRRTLIAVMGIEVMSDVTLIRHAYVLRKYQRQGIGGKLLAHLVQLAPTKRILVGTWADACWAICFYRKHGFRLMADKDYLLRRYWHIPRRQVETSVVLALDKFTSD